MVYGGQNSHLAPTFEADFQFIFVLNPSESYRLKDMENFFIQVIKPNRYLNFENAKTIGDGKSTLISTTEALHLILVRTGNQQIDYFVGLF